MREIIDLPFFLTLRFDFLPCRFNLKRDFLPCFLAPRFAFFPAFLSKQKGRCSNVATKSFATSPQKKNRLIFDGYPRTINQAKNLNNLLNKSQQKIDYIFFLNVNKNSIIKRVEKRKLLEKRTDDDAQTILTRYDTYMEVTKPVLDYYSKIKNFYEVDGSMEINKISQKIEEILNV